MVIGEMSWECSICFVLVQRLCQRGGIADPVRDQVCTAQILRRRADCVGIRKRPGGKPEKTKENGQTDCLNASKEMGCVFSGLFSFDQNT